MKECIFHFKIFLIIIPIVVLSLTGCEMLNVSGIEVSKAVFIRSVGVDKAPDGSGNVRLTIISRKMSASGVSNPKSGEETSNIINSEGETVFQALRDFSDTTNKNIFWGHVDSVLIGEEVAREDIAKYVNFFMRDHEFRLTAKLLIVKGTTAEEFMKKANLSNEFLPDKITSLSGQVSKLSVSKSIGLSDALIMFTNNTMSPYIPYIELIEASVKNKEDEGKMDVSLGGFAIFKNNKLFTFAEPNMARGINWINHDVKSGIVVIKDEYGGNVSVEIITADTKIKPEIKDNNLKITVDVKVTCNLDEQYTHKDLLTKSSLEYLEIQLTNSIYDEIQKALLFTQKDGLDVFNFSDKVYHKYPIKWDSMKKNWVGIFGKTPVTIIVNANIPRVYMINKPITEEENQL